MNVITQQNQQTMLHEHYNQANHAFQEGDYALALKSLEQALQYAETEKQVAHIQQSIRTVQEMMPQEPQNGPAQGQYQGQESQPGYEEVSSPAPGTNRMLLLTVLVGLICLTPIVMKCIEIFTQPSTKAEQPVAQAPAQAPGQPAGQAASVPANAAAPDAGTPASPVSTPDVIVDAGETAKWTVTSNGINLRATASTKASSLAKLSTGESVKMLEANAQQADGYIWSKVQSASGATGWVASQFVKQEAPAAAVAPAAPTDTVVNNPPAAPASAAAPAAAPAAAGTARNIGSNGVSLRAQAGTKAALITVLSKSQITVLPDAPVAADGFNWVKIRTEKGTEGWVADKFLAP